MNRHAIQVGIVGVGLHCNALAREARFRKIESKHPDLRSITPDAGFIGFRPELDGCNRGISNAKKVLGVNQIASTNALI